MNPLFGVVIPVLLALPVPLSAQVIKQEPQEGIFSTTSEVSGPRPLFELPADVPSEPGVATCHAHVPGISKGAIPIYLINRTATKNSIVLIGSDTNLKAYRKLDNSKWERVQPANGFVMCADSIIELAIPPGMFICVSVACPSSGTTATLRYQVADQWVSNEFQGFSIPKHVIKPSGILKAIKTAQLGPTSSNVLFRRQPPPIERRISTSEPASSSINVSLGKPPRSTFSSRYADFHAARLACDDALAAIDQLPEPLAEAASERFSLLRSRPAVAAATDLEFASRCLGYLRTKPDDSSYGHPSQYPGMCWEALAWLAGTSRETAAIPWTEVFALWIERLPDANLGEIVGMAKLLGNSRLTNEHLPSQILISLLKSSAPAMRENAVNRLLERNLDKDLAEAAAGLDEAGKAIVIRNVAADPKRFGRRYGPLNDFLIACAKANPDATFEAIDKSTTWDQAVYLEPGLSLAFGNFFVNIVSVGLYGPVKIEDYLIEIRVRRCMRYINRSSLLNKLADSEAYIAKKGETPISERRYFVAREARRQLLRLGFAP